MWKFSMDRHALQGKARDDNKKTDSRDLWIATILLAQNLAMTEKATILNTHKGGRIFDEKL